MKKSLLLTSVLAFGLMLNSSVIAATENNAQKAVQNKKAPIAKNFPKLYDKDGNELKRPPRPGEDVFDKDGNKLEPPMCHRHCKGPELNLTEDQKAQADKLREASKVKIKPIRQEIHKLKNQIWEIQDNDSLTKEEKHEKIAPLFKQIKELRSSADKIREEDMQQFEKLLTPEQKNTLEQFKKTHKPPKRPIFAKKHHF